MDDMNRYRLSFILLFAMVFMLFGWLTPVIYATYVPGDMVIEKHSFSAENASITQDTHDICFDRTVRRPASGRVFTELYLVSDGDATVRTEVSSETMQRYFQKGRHQAVTPLDLPNDIEAGRYKYLLVVKLDMADGRVTRDFVFNSQPFTVSNDIVANSGANDTTMAC
jgi:hypothetical protein